MTYAYELHVHYEDGTIQKANGSDLSLDAAKHSTILGSKPVLRVTTFVVPLDRNAPNHMA